MRKRVRVSPTGEAGPPVEAWQLRVGEKVIRFTRPEAAAELLEELGLRQLPTPAEVARTRKIPLYGQGWSVRFAPLPQAEFNAMERI